MVERTVAVPLRELDNGQLRVGGSRVALETVMIAFDQGASPEEIVYRYSTLHLDDVYAVLAYALQHRDDVDAYLHRMERTSEELWQELEGRFDPTSLRDRLLARKANLAAP